MAEPIIPEPGRQTRGPALSMLLASAFLVGSLVIAGLLLYPLFQPEQLPDPPASQNGDEQITETPAPTNEPESQETPLPEETDTDALSVTVASISTEVDLLVTNMLVEAIASTVAGSTTTRPVLVNEQNLSDVPSVSEIDRFQLNSQSDVLVLWEPAADDMLRMYILAGSASPILRLQAAPQPWLALSPAGVPLSVPENDPQFAIDVVVSLLEVTHGDPAGALQRIQHALSSTGEIPENRAIALFVRGLAESTQGNSIDALRDYSDAIRSVPDFSAALTNRGNVYLVLGDTPTALSAYNNVLASTPDLPGVLYNRVLTSLLSGELSTAEADVSRLLTETTPQAWHLNLRGVVRFNQGTYDAALADFQDAVAFDPENETLLFNLALTQFSAGNYEEAMTTYDSLLNLAPENAEYYLYQAQVVASTGDLEAVIELLTLAIELDDTYLDAYLKRGRLFVTVEDYESAQADALLALDLNPQAGQAHHIVADVLFANEEYREARNAYNAAIAAGNNSAEVYAGRGRAQHNLFNYAGAAADFQQALEYGYADPELLYLLGFALFDAGLHAASEDAFSAAVNAGYQTADAYAGLSLALDANVRRTEAEQAYAQALEMNESYADAEFLAEQPRWSQLAVVRAVTILRRMGEID